MVIIKLKVSDYLKKNEHCFALRFENEDLKKLYAFSEILKNADTPAMKGLIVDKNILGFTDSYRIASIIARKENSRFSEAKIYPASVVADFKVAKAVAILDDYTLALQIEDEVTEIKPLENVRPPKISIFIDTEKDYSTTTAKALIKSDYYLWKMFKRANIEDYYVEFKNKLARIICTPNEKSKIEINVMELCSEINLEKIGLNGNYLDNWFKTVKGPFELSIKNNKSAVIFKNENLRYVLMPYLIRDI